MRLLVTGGAGFIGANFVRHLVEAHPAYDVVVVDALTYAGHRSSLAPVEGRITFVEGDICDEAVMDDLMVGCDAVVHFAAESHVDRSIDDPGPFLRTNIMGTETLLRLPASTPSGGSTTSRPTRSSAPSRSTTAGSTRRRRTRPSDGSPEGSVPVASGEMECFEVVAEGRKSSGRARRFVGTAIPTSSLLLVGIVKMADAGLHGCGLQRS